MTVLISTLKYQTSCFISKRLICQRNIFYMCEEMHPVLKDFCDWKFLKECKCGKKIIKSAVYMNSNANQLEEENKFRKVKVPSIFEIENGPCFNKSLIRENIFNPSIDNETFSFSVNNFLSQFKTREEVNEKKAKGNTAGHLLLYMNHYYNLYHALEQLYEIGLDIFIENDSGFCLAHIYEIHRHFIIWFCKKHNIDPYQEYSDYEFMMKCKRV